MAVIRGELDNERRQILSEYALVSRNEKASGGVFDLTTA